MLISTRADAPSYLTSISAVARDREGKVLAGAETLQPSAGSIREASQLALALPAGERFGLELHARTSDPKPAECEASVGSLAVEAGASAQLRMLAWRCAERTGYVPPSVDATCYWLVDWLSVAQSDASVGVEVRTRVQPSPALEREPTILWAAEPASVGHFIQPSAADTSFVCDEGGREVILHVRADTGDCAEQLSVPFFCGD